MHNITTGMHSSAISTSKAKEFQAAGDPVVSVDTKKKEMVGNYKNAGREWHREGVPVQVRTHDFPDADLGKAIPYGIYDLTAESGWVSVGTDHDTAAFAVASIRRWWHAAGRIAYPASRHLLITADAGGSNGYRTRAWKFELAAPAVETGLEITVCHFPPGTSKWNKVEHRLFSHILERVGDGQVGQVSWPTGEGPNSHSVDTPETASGRMRKRGTSPACSGPDGPDADIR